MKKTPSKVAHNQPPTFFFSILAWLPKRPKKQKSRTPKSPLMQDWVFRLGIYRPLAVHDPRFNPPIPTAECMKKGLVIIFYYVALKAFENISFQKFNQP